MDHLTAKEIIQAVGNVNAAIGELTAKIELISDMGEKKLFRKGAAELMIGVYDSLMRPILKEHPDLDPDK